MYTPAVPRDRIGFAAASWTFRNGRTSQILDDRWSKLPPPCPASVQPRRLCFRSDDGSAVTTGVNERQGGNKELATTLNRIIVVLHARSKVHIDLARLLELCDLTGRSPVRSHWGAAHGKLSGHLPIGQGRCCGSMRSGNGAALSCCVTVLNSRMLPGQAYSIRRRRAALDSRGASVLACNDK